MDKVATKPVRPVGKRTMAEVAHVVATRRVWQRREYIWVGYYMNKRCTRKKPGGQEVDVAVYYTTSVPLNIQNVAIKQRWPKHNFQSTPGRTGWTTRTVCLEGCLASTTCVSTAVVERCRQESTWSGGWVNPKICTAYIRLHVGF